MRTYLKRTESTLFAAAGLAAAFACSAGDKGGSTGRAGVGDNTGTPTMPGLIDEGPPMVGNPGGEGFGDIGGLSGTPGSGCMTTVSGVTRDPAGRLPLYNVVAYVPSEALSPISRGASCETCSGDFSGRPIAAAVSDASGAFTLDITNVPMRENIPLVIQAGKWRRQVTIPAAGDCADTALDTELTRLPKNRTEGNLPHVAVMRGGSDALECLFTKIGVDPAEFTPGGGGGSVELYYSANERATAETGQMMGAAGPVALPAGDTLFENYEAMKDFDMVLLSCEGGDERYGTANLVHRENVHRYANEGGRLFGGHYHNALISNNELDDGAPTSFPEVVDFASGNGDVSPKLFTADVNTSFDKGKALADWLMEVGGSTQYGRVEIFDSGLSVLGMVHPTAVSWINTTESNGAALYYSFPTPVDAPACGRMVFTDVHLSSGSGDSGKAVFPSCSAELSPQQLALAFLIFDLSNCVQTTDTEPPVTPMIY